MLVAKLVQALQEQRALVRSAHHLLFLAFIDLPLENGRACRTPKGIDLVGTGDLSPGSLEPISSPTSFSGALSR